MSSGRSINTRGLLERAVADQLGFDVKRGQRREDRRPLRKPEPDVRTPTGLARGQQSNIAATRARRTPRARAGSPSLFDSTDVGASRDTLSSTLG